MATAEEILAAAFSSEAITIDVENRTLSIPTSLNHIGVEADDDVFKLPFILPRYYGDIDLSEFDININYVNASGEGDVYDVTDAVVGVDEVTFSWLIGRYATISPGNVEFNVCLKKYNAEDTSLVDQEFNTMPATVKVLEGLETSEAVVEENPELLTRWMNGLCDQINALSDKVRRLDMDAGGSGDGYGYISFVDGVLIFDPGNAGGGDSGEDTTYGHTIYFAGVQNANIYINKDMTNAFAVNPGVTRYDNVSTFKFVSTDGFSYSFKAGAPDSSGSAITPVQDSLGWYTLTRDTTVNITSNGGSGGGDSGEDSGDEEVTSHTLYVVGASGKAIYINSNAATAFNISSNNTSFENVTKFKFVDEEGISYYFTSGISSENGTTITPQQVAGWYILEQDLTVRVTVNNSGSGDDSGGGSGDDSGGGSGDDSGDDTTAYSLSGKWMFNETVDLPDALILLENVSVMTGDNYSTLITGIATIDGTGMMYNEGSSGSGVYAISSDGVWTDESYRYLDFGDGKQDVGEDFYTWFVANATSVESGSGDDDSVATVNISGKWLLNEDITSPDGTFKQEVSAYTGSTYSTPISDIANMSLYMMYEIEGTYVKVWNHDDSWANSGYRYIDFGTGGCEVSEEFYTWFVANATNA